MITAGFALLAACVLVAWLAGGKLWFLLPGAWLPIALWIPWFFRDPLRTGPRGDRVISAPADGKVVAVAELSEPCFIRGPARRISVFMNVLNVHVNRYPVDGQIEYRHYRPGKFVNAAHDKASEDNEQMSIGIQTDRGPVLVRQIAGLIARRIVTDSSIGDSARQGERLGLIRFGSRVDTFVPIEAEARVSLGDQTRAGVTVIAPKGPSTLPAGGSSLPAFWTCWTALLHA